MTQYTIKTEDNNKLIDVVYYGKHVPIIRSVLYEVHCCKYLSIIDGERLWNKEVHGMYFPLLEFKETWDPKFYIETQKLKTKECVSWLRFDLDFHIQRLIPHIPATSYIQHVRKGQPGLEYLVYKIGGVCPLALSRTGNGNNDLIRDAANLKHVVDVTKRIRSSVWLSQHDCAPFMVDDAATRASFARLRENGAIVRRTTETGETQIALAWAAKLDEARSSSAATVRVGTIVPFREPSCDKNAELIADPSLRMDRCIDFRSLPCTMWSCVTWPTASLAQRELEGVVHAVGRQQAIEIIKAELHRIFETEGATTYIVFSSQGRIGVDQPGSWTCCNKEGKIRRVQVCVRSPNALLVDGVEVPKRDVFAEWECCDRRRWTDIAYMNISSDSGLGVIAGIFATPADMEWASRIFANARAKKILVQLVKKE